MDQDRLRANNRIGTRTVGKAKNSTQAVIYCRVSTKEQTHLERQLTLEQLDETEKRIETVRREMAKRLAIVGDALEDGLVDAQEAADREREIIKVATDEQVEIRIERIKELEKVAKEAAEKMRDAFQDAGDAITNIFEAFTRAGKLNIASLIRDVLRLIDILIRASQGAKGGGLVGALGGLLSSAVSGIFHVPAPIPILPLPPASALGLPGISIPTAAHGGLFTDPTLALIGEGGPEAVIPLDRIERGRGDGVTVVQNFNLSVGVPEAVRREVNALRPLLKRDAIDAVLEARNRGGSFTKLIGERAKG